MNVYKSKQESIWKRIKAYIIYIKAKKAYESVQKRIKAFIGVQKHIKAY